MAEAPLMLSVSGLRGLVGESLTDAVAARFAVALGRWLMERRDDDKPPHVVIGRDSRPSGKAIESAVVAALASMGVRLDRVGVISTPGVGVMAEHLNADAGLVVTASHNPLPWNGLKPLVRDGSRIGAPTRMIADRIIELFHAETATPTSRPTPSMGLRNDAVQHHVQCVLQQVDVEAIRSRRFKAVVDSVNGAGGAETAMLMHELGVTLIPLHAEPTGVFAHPPEPLRENLGGLRHAVSEHSADVGFAQDPDADRLAIVDETGAYIGEEYSLALSCLHVLSRAGGARGVKLATNLSTSRMIDDVAAMFGAAVLRTAVGEANVAAAMQQHRMIIGGEGNGGVILPAVSYVRDSLVGMALILEMLAVASQTVGQAVRRIPGYCIVKDKVAVSSTIIERLTPALQREFADQRIDLHDGVRIDWPDRWVHVRASNTEPIVRLIAESKTQEEAVELIARAKTALGV